MAVGTRRLRRNERKDDYRHTTTPEQDVEKARSEYYEAKDNYEKACLNKHGRKTGCQEAFGLLKTAAKGAGIILNHLGDASSKMSDMVEEDLYRRSPAGARDKALVKLMMEQKEAAKKGTTKNRQRNEVLVYIDGKPRIVNKSDVVFPTRRSNSRRR